MPDLPPDGMVIVWTIACPEGEVEVYEDGRVKSGSTELRERVLARLQEPVDVTRTGAGGVAMVLHPGDRRYVVARVRRLVEDEPEMDVLGVRFAGDETPG